MGTRGLVGVILVAMLLSGCVHFPAERNNAYRFHDHLAIPSASAVIAANIYLPNMQPTTRFPAIIMPNSWGMNQYEYTKQARRFAEEGYVVLSYSARGWEQSSGEVGAGDAEDMQDIHSIINWLIKYANVDKDRIGMVGISYGGGLSLLAAEHDSRIKAVASLSGWTNLLNSFYYNQTPSIRVSQNLLSSAQSNKARLKPELIETLQQFKQYKITDAAKKWALQHSAITYIHRLNNSVAIYLNNNFQDTLFNSADSLAFYQKLKIPNKKLTLSQGLHGSAEAGGLIGWNNEQWNQVLAWFDHYLKGKNNHVETGLFIQEKLNGPYVSHSTLPKQNLKLYLQAETQRYYGYLDPINIFDNRINYILPGDSHLTTGTSRFKFVELMRLLQAITPFWKGPAHLQIRTIHQQFSTFYILRTPIGQKSLQIIGQPSLSLWVKVRPTQLSIKTPSQMIVYLYDVDPSLNNASLITYAPTTLYNKTALNQWQYITIPLYLTAYDVAPGHYIALGIGTFDELYTSSQVNLQNNGIELAYARQQKSTLLMLPFQNNQTT